MTQAGNRDTFCGVIAPRSPGSPRPPYVIWARNSEGKRCGESHYNATISDLVVDLLRARYESGTIGYRRLAREFGLRRDTVIKIVKYERRTHTAMYWQTVWSR